MCSVMKVEWKVVMGMPLQLPAELENRKTKWSLSWKLYLKYHYCHAHLEIYDIEPILVLCSYPVYEDGLFINIFTDGSLQIL